MPEIEMKFRLSNIPPADIVGHGTSIAQGYLLTEGGELRIRRKGERCYLTIKGQGDLSRDEWGSEIPLWAFELLWPQTEGRRVEKTRYRVSHKEFELEIDEYGGQLEGLVTLECELPDEASATKFSLPSWAAK